MSADWPYPQGRFCCPAWPCKQKAGSSPACLALGAHPTSAIPLSVMNTRDIHPGEICVWLCALTCMCGDAFSQDKRIKRHAPLQLQIAAKLLVPLRRRASICGSSHLTLGRRGQRFHFASEVRVCRSPIIFSTTDLESGEMTDQTTTAGGLAAQPSSLPLHCARTIASEDAVPSHAVCGACARSSRARKLQRVG